MCVLFVLFAFARVYVCMCIPIRPHRPSALREHMYPPTPTYQPTLSYPPTHPQLSLTPPSPPSLFSHTSLCITPPTRCRPNTNTAPHHTTPFQPLRSTAVGTSTPSTPSPPPTLPLRHACTCTPTRLQRCAPARRSVRVRLCCRVGECKNSDRRGAISGLCCVCRRGLR
jgi:hypothetical protein